jgi:hypothetical protein
MRELFWFGAVVLLLLIILGLLIFNLIAYLDWQNLDEALTVAETAEGFCTPNNQVCIWEPTDMSPVAFSTDFSNQTALLLADLIGRLEYATDNVITSPPGFTLVKSLNSGNSPVFCGMWFNQSDLYIVFRGTQTQSEWTKDLQTAQIELEPGILVHSGFWDVFQEFEPVITSTINDIQPTHLYITGHSLGAAVASLAGMTYYPNREIVVYAFASPLVGNLGFAKFVNANFALHRVTNRDDIIPQLPPNVMFNLTGDHSVYLYARAGLDHSFSLNFGSWLNNHHLPIITFCLSNSECVLTVNTY